MAVVPVKAPEFLAPISREIWGRKYRFAGSGKRAADQSLGDTFRRVAEAAAGIEKGKEGAGEVGSRVL